RRASSVQTQPVAGSGALRARRAHEPTAGTGPDTSAGAAGIAALGLVDEFRETRSGAVDSADLRPGFRGHRHGRVEVADRRTFRPDRPRSRLHPDTREQPRRRARAAAKTDRPFRWADVTPTTGRTTAGADSQSDRATPRSRFAVAGVFEHPRRRE